MPIKIKNIKALILDMDGVLWRENEPIGNLPEIFKQIIALGIKYVMATNNSTHTVEQYVKKVRSFNIPIESWQIINSSLAFCDCGYSFVFGFIFSCYSLRIC